MVSREPTKIIGAFGAIAADWLASRPVHMRGNSPPSTLRFMLRLYTTPLVRTGVKPSFVSPCEKGSAEVCGPVMAVAP